MAINGAFPTPTNWSSNVNKTKESTGTILLLILEGQAPAPKRLSLKHCDMPISPIERFGSMMITELIPTLNGPQRMLTDRRSKKDCTNTSTTMNDCKLKSVSRGIMNCYMQLPNVLGMVWNKALIGIPFDEASPISLCRLPRPLSMTVTTSGMSVKSLE